jgi:hypothetical protein
MKNTTALSVGFIIITVASVGVANRFRTARSEIPTAPPSQASTATTSEPAAPAPVPGGGGAHAGSAALTAGARVYTADDLREAMLPENSRTRWRSDPALRLLFEQKMRLNLQVIYGPFFRRHRISQETRERLIRAWNEREEIKEELTLLARIGGMESTATERRSFSLQADAALRDAEQKILGSERAADLLAYRQTQPVRDFVMNFAGEATLAGLAVTPEQVDQLEVMLIATRPGRAIHSFGSLNWDAITAALPAVLSPGQIELLLPEVRARQASNAFITAALKAQGKLD